MRRGVLTRACLIGACVCVRERCPCLSDVQDCCVSVCLYVWACGIGMLGEAVRMWVLGLLWTAAMCDMGMGSDAGCSDNVMLLCLGCQL